MLCPIYKWKISGAMDSGKPFSGRVKLHLLRCASCREFARHAEETGRLLTEEAVPLLKTVDASLIQRVQTSLATRVESGEPRSKQSFRLKPILAAGASLIVVGLSVIWVVRSRPQGMPELTPPFQLERPGAYLETAVTEASSPYEKEIRQWKEVFNSTAKTLEACLDIHLGEEKK